MLLLYQGNLAAQRKEQVQEESARARASVCHKKAWNLWYVQHVTHAYMFYMYTYMHDSYLQESAVWPDVCLCACHIVKSLHAGNTTVLFTQWHGCRRVANTYSRTLQCSVFGVSGLWGFNPTLTRNSKLSHTAITIYEMILTEQRSLENQQHFSF